MNGLLINSVSYSQELKSNVESGNGYIDLVVLSASNDSVVILELKKTDNPFDDRKKIAREAVQQIIDTGYAEAYMDNETICSVYAYGLCFCKKTCSSADCCNERRCHNHLHGWHVVEQSSLCKKNRTWPLSL